MDTREISAATLAGTFVALATETPELKARSGARVERLEVIDTAFLAEFSFTKFLMWLDLEAKRDALGLSAASYADIGAGIELEQRIESEPQRSRSTKFIAGFSIFLPSPCHHMPETAVLYGVLSLEKRVSR